MSRFLRSKKLRTLLFMNQQGRCAACGIALDDSWHADHVVPWVITQDTNVHEMQALCAPCNLAKGAST